MLKKNTRKRLLAGALATVMMLTMCPSWALADDEDIAAPLPLVDENRPVAESAPVETDTTETPADSTPSAPEAKPAEGQDTAPAPSDGGANGGTDSTESGNSTNPTIPEGSENNSQNNDTVSNSPENEISMASPDAVPYGWNDVKTIEAEYWITNLHAEDDNGSWKLSIDKDTVGEDGKSVAELAPPERRATADETYNTVFWQARVLHWYEHQTTLSNADKTQSGTEITSIRYKNDRLEYCAKDSSDWTAFARNDQLVFYYLIRTDYSEMVQIDVSDWTVDKEQTQHLNRRSVTYQVIVDGGDDNGKVLDSKKFWYNKAFTVSSVRVRQTESENYSINRVELDPSAMGTVDKVDGEYRFSLNLTKAKRDNATVKIYVTPNVDPHQLTYKLNGGEITSEAGTYTPEGLVYPDAPVITPTAEKTDCVFDGWYTDEALTQKWTGTKMPNENLTLYACFTPQQAPNPNPDPEPELTPAKYFVLLPTRSAPENNDDQGEEFYLPSSKSNGGVSDLDQSTGYVGSLTKEGMDVVSKVGDSVTDTVNGVSKSYLKVPTDLGFFTPGNWNEDGTYNDPLADTSILGDNFNVNDIKIVWYTIKNQGMKDDKLDIHVDGYVKNVAINVTYHSNFGTDATYNDGTKTGTNYTALDYSKTGLPTRDGYEFRGWYTDTACETPYTAKVLMTGLHLYAKWVPNNFEVSYFYQNDQGTETQFGDIDTYAFGTDVTVRTAHPEKAGYTFTGWANIANIVEVAADGTFTMPAQDVRFDAQFSINQYHVTYKVDGKDYGNTETYVFNSDVAIRPVPTKEGYTFTGWKIGTADAENFKMPAHDVIIEGTCAINRYTVTYKVDTEVVGTDVYDFNSDVVIRDIPTKEGYTFSGWKIGTADAENFKMPAHDVTIEGTFAKNSSGHHHRKPTVTIPDKVPTGLNGNDHYAYIVGYPDKTVRPQNGITRAEVATIFFRLLTDETRNANSTKSNSYSDVAAGAWYNHAVSTLSAMGIVKGDSNGKFNPNAPITRAEFAAIAARFDDKANSTTADFSDIVSHWAKNEISAASNNGWINGYPDGTFRPDNKITRAEAMTLVNRVLKRLPETAEDLHDDMIKWSDNSDASQWFYLAVQEATNSHYYKAKENKSEKWTELRDTRDWTELEK